MTRGRSRRRGEHGKEPAERTETPRGPEALLGAIGYVVGVSVSDSGWSVVRRFAQGRSPLATDFLVAQSSGAWYWPTEEG